MGTRLGLVGLPNVGKSTLFNALTRGKAQVAPYPFTTRDPNVGVAPVEDPRLTALAQVVPHDRVVATTLELVDIAGLIRGAHRGEGLGNEFLSHIVTVDALLHVVRCFDDPVIPHAMETVDPLRDVEVVTTELLLKDLELVERRLEREAKVAKSGDAAAKALAARLTHWQQALAQGVPLRRLPDEPDQRPQAWGLACLSAKPVIYVANLDERTLAAPPPAVQALAQHAAREGAELIVVCAKLEAELAELEPADRTAMMAEMGVSTSALPQIVRSGSRVLQLITFFTTASRILQAWTVPQGATAPQAAGVIHSDFARLFIRAEVIGAETLIACGGEGQARATGQLRVEGREYVVRDGDVMHFRVGS